MRIVYVLDQFPSVSETFILREMAALREHGHTIVPFSMAPGEREVLHDGAAPFLEATVTRPALLSPSFAWQCWKAFAQRPGRVLSAAGSHLRRTFGTSWPWPRLLGCLASACALTPAVLQPPPGRVHAHFGGYTGIVGLLLSRITGLPYSFSMHARDLLAERSPLLPEQIAAADFVTVCTEFGLGIARELAPPDEEGKLHLVRHGLDLSAFDGVLSEAEPHRHDDPPCVLAVGRLVPKKGFDVLIRAIARLHQAGRPVALEVIGDGPQRDALLRLARELSVDGSVYFMGYMAHAEVVRHLKGVAMLVAPSVVGPDGDQDGLPNVILEAMAARVPVVASDLSGIPEAVEDGRTGFLVPPGDEEALSQAIVRVLDDGREGERLVAGARRMVEERFDIRRNILPLLALFEGKPRNEDST